MSDLNQSGIYPTGNKLLVLPEEIETTTAGGIIIPETETEKYQLAQCIATIVHISELAWDDYEKPFAELGDRVLIAKYGGLMVTGKDGKTYRVIHDTDVTAKVDPDLEYSDLKPRVRKTA